MIFEVIEGSRVLDVADPEHPTVLFLLEGRASVFPAPRVIPMLEPLELVDARAVVLEGTLEAGVVPDELSMQIVREVFFEFEVTDAHCRTAVNYLFQRLETCELLKSGSLSDRVMNWLPQHLDEEINLDALSELVGCSKSGLLSAFKRAGLRPPMKELAQLRIDRSCYLLKENELNVSQIARSVGYDDPAAFNHFFRRYMGRSPSDYRENCIWIS